MNNKNNIVLYVIIIYSLILLIFENILKVSFWFYIPLLLIISIYILKIIIIIINKNLEPKEIKVPMSTYDKRKEDIIISSISYNDIAGLDEIKEDFDDIINYLKHEDDFKNMDAKIPKGAILYGPPGTGKTLLAKAIAGEATANFIYASGSEFVEKYVGVGAKRVRSLFERAKREAPSIIFIDEIDALGAKRNADSNNEKDQTLNQLLVELDGFNNNENVVVIAATNRIDLLDEALLRPGRFDRKIFVGNPNYNSRLKILEVHTKNKPLDNKVSLSDIANKTSGFSGAQLANLANEAALNAVKEKKKKIAQCNFEYAIEKIAAGLETKNSTVSTQEKKIVAIHESGHAVVAKLLNIDKIQKISIIPRNIALGYVLKFPVEDKYLYTKQELYDRITVFLAGRAAEEIFIGEISSGATNDIKEATDLAYDIICKYGMSKSIENIYVNETFYKYYFDSIKEEATVMIKSLYKKSLCLLQENKNLVEIIANYLLKYETINYDTIESIFEQNMYTKKKSCNF